MTLRDFQTDFNKNLGRNIQRVGRLLDELIQQLPSGQAKNTLNYALDWVKPSTLALGLRLRRWSASEIEVFIPNKTRNCEMSAEGQGIHIIMDSVLITAGLEAFQALWKRQFREPKLSWQTKEVIFKRLQHQSGPLIVRWELNEVKRELLMTQLQNHKTASVEGHLRFFQEDEMLVAEMTVSSQLFLTEMLDWKIS